MTFKTIDDYAMTGARVLVRVDLNAPVRDGAVTDDTRLRAIRPTVDAILAKGGRPVLLAHFDRPKGKIVPEMSLRQILPALKHALGRDVAFAADCRGDAVEALTRSLPDGHVLLCENTRFHPGEEKNDPAFAEALAKLGDIYVNDAFSAAHRAHASTEGVARLLPACAGRLMEADLRALESALAAPERPVLAVVGGAKVSTKLDLLGNLVGRVDVLVIGGAMANTFLLAQGHGIGKSLAEPEMTATALEILDKAKAAGCAVMLPTDVVAADGFAADSPHEVAPADAAPADRMILDAGPASVAAVAARLETVKTVVWNGPFGAFEIKPFDAATVAAARKVAALTKAGAVMSVAGGGDTVAALNAAGVAGDFSFVSTAGGAFLEWLEGKTLPGVAALG